MGRFLDCLALIIFILFALSPISTPLSVSTHLFLPTRTSSSSLFTSIPFHITQTSLNSSSSSSLSSASELSNLLSSTRGASFTPQETRRLRELVDSFATAYPPPSSLDVNGEWELSVILKPDYGDDTNEVPFFSIDSWRNYLTSNPKGPSPVQALVTSASSVGYVTQILTPSRFDNIVSFEKGPFKGNLIVRGLLEKRDDNKLTFRFTTPGSRFLVDSIWGGFVSIPYPVPFKLLGDKALGWLDTIGYDEETGVRVAKGNKGSTFVFNRQTDFESRRLSEAIEYDELVEGFDEGKISGRTDLTETPIILCPAQFSTDSDYIPLIAELNKRGHPVFPVKLTWLQWLSIIKSSFTEEYWKGTLPLKPSLDFYLDSIDDQVSKLPRGTEYSILAHSIGGWVSRGYLTNAPPSVSGCCKALVTLGTPNKAPPSGSLAAKLDQTRGLLNDVNSKPNIAGTKYVSVVSNKVKGGWKSLDSLLALSSYFALSGTGTSSGDGITDSASGTMMGDDAETITCDAVHMNFLPSPAPFPNPRILGARWYGDFVDDWLSALK